MSNLMDRRFDKFILLSGDLILIICSYVIAFFLRYQQIAQRNWDAFISLIPWILLISVFFLSIYELYTLNRKTVWDVVRSIIIASTFITFITMSASFIFREFALPRSVILFAYIFMVIFLSVWKLIYSKIRRRHKDGVLLFIGSHEEAGILAASTFTQGLKIIQVGVTTELEQILRHFHQIDCVMVTPMLPEENKAQIIYQAMKHKKIVYVIPSLYDLLLSKSIITSLDDTMIFAVKPFGLPPEERVIKRFFDIIVSFILLVLLSPLFLITSILIKLEGTNGRVIFKQKRIGQHGKEFLIYKFRSMIEDAEKDTGPVIAEEQDNRITRVGRFLRLTRIDELPQLFNVLKGDMSIVGPRPEREFFIKQFAQQYESYEYRNVVKPGITGYAQIMGKYTTNVLDKLRYDLYYIRNYSFWLDVVIMLRTIIVLLDKTKAEGKGTSKTKENKETFPSVF